ncbi:EscU/YscU/HrcU family type III secretion system export apparatus switch protein [Pantoea cypripedii]|uniref:EscU/YscU/HrcU family type III secretion system export apparatus switch protein n=1 Tax=Pantoea cypripedii TaxID=55209 RepID=UPI002FC6B340
MAEKTEKPTHKKIRDSRKKGQVAVSKEVTSGMLLVMILGYFSLEGPALWRALQNMHEVAISAVNQSINFGLGQIMGAFVSLMLRFMGGLGVLLVVTAIFTIMGQIGPLIANEAIKPSFKKLNVVSNAKNMVSKKNLFEFVKSLAKVLVLSLIFFLLLTKHTPSLQFLPLHPITTGLEVCLHLFFWMLISVIGFYVVIGIVDLAFQKYDNTKKMMMSLEEIKQENKNSEGNPEIKQKRKEIHREIQSGSLDANVKKSTAVVRNPTHIAVCLYYEPGVTPLPQVIEMGRDKRALHIVKLAEKAGVPVIENIPVARGLANGTEVGGYIPSELFEPVAHILRLAMNLDYEEEEDDDED